MEWREHRGHVLIISHDVIGRQMAGPGIRYFHLARILSQEFEVALMIPGESVPESSSSFTILAYALERDERLEHMILDGHVVVVPAVLVASLPVLQRAEVPIVVDGYDPYIPETLHLGRAITELERRLVQAYLVGDFFLCASDRQRDWWLGLLEASGRINPYTFGEDPSLRRLVDVVPFGLPSTPPQHTRQVVKGVWPGIREEDRVILWGGGLWLWLDPLTAIRAVGRVYRERRDVRLIFPGTRHPNAWLKGIPTHNEPARRLAQELDLLGKAVFFGDWIPYTDWPAALLESDVALTLHYDSLETRLAFRSRVLDYIWAGLPVVATCGDATSDLIEKYQLGVVVDYEDEVGVAEAILKLL
ncbi:MAG TPA: glycosyltransferase, partial [Anaerolineae bacterium]|nr:glycosyltransferase [Anaerolineae bacterium]